MSVTEILAGIAIFLAVISIFPATEKYPLLSVAVLLVGIALFLIGR